MGFSSKSSSSTASLSPEYLEGKSMGESMFSAREELLAREKRKKGIESTVLTRPKSPSLGQYNGLKQTLG